MQKMNRFRLSFGTSLATVILLASPVAVYARGGNDSTTTSGSTETETHNSTTIASGQTETEHATEVETQSADDSTELHHKGDSLLAEMHKKHGGDKKNSPEKQKKVCEAHKEGLTNKFSHIASNSQRAQTRIDDILAKSLAFQASSNQTPTGFTALVAAANTAKANSAASIAALQAVTPTVDCNKTSVASDVATFKVAAQQTRANLKAYKTAVKAVLHSLEAAKDSTEGSTN